MNTFFYDKLYANRFVSPNGTSDDWNDVTTTVENNSASWAGAKAAGGGNATVQVNYNGVLSGFSGFTYDVNLSSLVIGTSSVNEGAYSAIIASNCSRNKGTASAIIGGCFNNISVLSSTLPDIYDSNFILGRGCNTISVSGIGNAIINSFLTTISASSGSVILANNSGDIWGSKNSVIMGGGGGRIVNSENSVMTFSNYACICNSKNSTIIGASLGTILNAEDSIILNSNGNTCIVGTASSKVYYSGIGAGCSHCIISDGVTPVSGSYIAGGLTNRIYRSSNSTIIGGNNLYIIDSCNSVIGGGGSSTINRSCNSIIGAGQAGCIVDSVNSVIGGGGDGARCLIGNNSFIGVGSNVYLSGNDSFVGTGQNNYLKGHCSVITGGWNNTTCFNNTFILGSYLIASAPDYTYVNNISSQCCTYTDKLLFNSLSAGSAVCCAGATQTCEYITINVAGSALYLPLYCA